MKISYEHLMRYFDEKPSIQDISERLFQLGHENEINNNILDIEITPNRGDCLSLNGLARDLGIFYDIKNPHKIYEGPIEKLDINFTNFAPEDCPSISFLSIQIENLPKDYESYLESYFIDNDAACRLCLKTETSLIAKDFFIWLFLFLTIISKGEIEISFALVKFLIVFFTENLFIKKP